MRPSLGLAAAMAVMAAAVAMGAGDGGDGDWSEGEREVLVSGGMVRGGVKRSEGGREYLAFQAIPYALPPTNRSRFMPPQPGAGWEGILDGSQPGEPCAQAALGITAGVEDCLNLYVYTPKVPRGDTKVSLPVVVWLHGGSFVIGGAATLDERMLMDRDIVLVIPQYRLGILGYFQTMKGFSPGNMGALDQVEALKWVQENIHVFGGDPGQVTLAGDCAGAASSLYHMMSPLSHGLFHRVLSLSGSPLNPWALYTNNHRFMLILAKYIRCPANDPKLLVKCLQEIDEGELLEAAQLVMEARDLLVGNHRVSPAVQVPADSHVTSLFLAQHPLMALTRGDLARVPVLMTLTKDVGSYLVDMVFYDFLLAMMEDKEDFLPTVLPMLLKECLIPEPKDHVEEFGQFYFPGIVFDDLNLMLPGLAEMLGDLHYKAGIFNAASLLSQHVPTHFLRFEYEGGPKLFDLRHPNASSAPPLPPAVGHGDEMALILPDQEFMEYTEDQKRVGKELIDIIENFVYGRLPRDDWPLFTPESQETLVMGADGSFRKERFASPEKTEMLKKINSYHHHKIVKRMAEEDSQPHDEL